jgi:hypothetical protein
MGHYCSVVYSIKQQKYIYCEDLKSENWKEYFKSENWEEFHAYVWKDLLDIFIRFNR